MVDFNKLRRQRTHVTPIDPIEIFLRLPKPPGIDDLWNSQAEALRSWFDRRGERDLVIKLNTGGGKTLVGLLIAQSTINEHGGPVLYLSPNNQLVVQTLAKADEYGINAVRYSTGGDLDDMFLSGKKVMVATYAALFNGLSLFGIFGGRRDIVKLKGLILDDAHTAFADMRDQFTISIDSSETDGLYSELVYLFRNDFSELGRQGTFDDIVGGRDEGVLEVPYWSWLLKHTEIREKLSQFAQDSFPFQWPLIRDYFPICHTLISSRSFSITPLYPIVDMFPSFADCPRRIYMSATVADDSSIIRTFDASIDTISKPIAPTSLAGVGERMILAPELMSIKGHDLHEITERLIKWAAKTYGVIILVPSGRAAARWNTVAIVAQGDEVAARIDELVGRANNGPYVFPNRYDGIDLPKDSCRLLVLSGLPRGSNSYDLYRAAVFEGSSAINTTIAQRVEQGMGRGTRGAGDHCVVILTWRDLIAWISRTSNLNLLSSSTRAQLKLGLEISRDINSLEELSETTQKCFNRDKDWTEYHAEALAEATASTPPNPLNLLAAQHERRYFKLIKDGYYEKAIGILEKFIQENDELDDRMKGWVLQLAARAAYLFNDKEKSNQLQQQAYGYNRALLRPRASQPYVHVATPSKQSENIIEQLTAFALRKGFLEHFEEIADWLTRDATSNQFEEAMKKLGVILGFYSERPDNDYKVGPDVLWIMDEATALVIEVKSRKHTDNPLTREDHGQLLESFEWFQHEYPDLEGYKVVVHPNTLATPTVTVGDSFALTLQNLSFLIINIRELITDLCSIPMREVTLMTKCEQRLIELDLAPKKLIDRFLESFHTQT